MNRQNYFDNAKFILILLVVMGHLFEPVLKEHVTTKIIYVFLYIFHMPMFALISGYFSKADSSLDYFWKNVQSLIFPYVVLQVLVSLLILLRDGNLDIMKCVFYPHDVLWYLFCLFVWRFILPYFIKLKYPVIIALVAALACGYVNSIDRFLTLSRLIVFFSFFIIGYRLKTAESKLIIHKLIPRKLAIIIISLALAASFKIYDVNLHWLYFDSSYRKLGHPEYYAAVYRFVLICAGFLTGLSFLVIIPDRKLFFTQLGSKTIYVFLLHSIFILRILEYINFFEFFTEVRVICLLFPVFAFSLCLILSSRIVTNLAMPIVNPSFLISILLKYRNKLFNVPLIK